MAGLVPGLVPAIGRGTLPLRMAGTSPGTSPAMTGTAGFIQVGSATAGRRGTRNDTVGRRPGCHRGCLAAGFAAMKRPHPRADRSRACFRAGPVAKPGPSRHWPPRSCCSSGTAWTQAPPATPAAKANRDQALGRQTRRAEAGRGHKALRIGDEARRHPEVAGRSGGRRRSRGT